MKNYPNLQQSQAEHLTLFSPSHLCRIYPDDFILCRTIPKCTSGDPGTRRINPLRIPQTYCVHVSLFCLHRIHDLSICLCHGTFEYIFGVIVFLSLTYLSMMYFYPSNAYSLSIVVVIFMCSTKNTRRNKDFWWLIPVVRHFC